MCKPQPQEPSSEISKPFLVTWEWFWFSNVVVRTGGKSATMSVQVDRIRTWPILMLTSQKSRFFFSMTRCLVWHILLHLCFFSCQLTFVCGLIVVTMYEENFVKEKYPDLYDPQSQHYKANTKNVIGSARYGWEIGSAGEQHTIDFWIGCSCLFVLQASNDGHHLRHSKRSHFFFPTLTSPKGKILRPLCVRLSVKQRRPLISWIMWLAVRKISYFLWGSKFNGNQEIVPWPDCS